MTERTILFVDLVRFTSITAVHGDEAAADAASALAELAARTGEVPARLVKSLGDGVLLEAADPRSALRAGEYLVHGVHRLGRGLDVRGGADHGPLVSRGGDVFGTTVNVASRLAALPPPGAFAVTRPVAMAAGSLGLAVEPKGARRLRGLPDPLEVFEVDVCTHDAEWISDPVCGMRLDPAGVTEWVIHGADRLGFCGSRCADRFRADPSAYRQG